MPYAWNEYLSLDLSRPAARRAAGRTHNNKKKLVGQPHTLSSDSLSLLKIYSRNLTLGNMLSEPKLAAVAQPMMQASRVFGSCDKLENTLMLN